MVAWARCIPPTSVRTKRGPAVWPSAPLHAVSFPVPPKAATPNYIYACHLGTAANAKRETPRTTTPRLTNSPPARLRLSACVSTRGQHTPPAGRHWVSSCREDWNYPKFEPGCSQAADRSSLFVRLPCTCRFRPPESIGLRGRCFWSTPAGARLPSADRAPPTDAAWAPDRDASSEDPAGPGSRSGALAALRTVGAEREAAFGTSDRWGCGSWMRPGRHDPPTECGSPAAGSPTCPPSRTARLHAPTLSPSRRRTACCRRATKAHRR